MKIVIINRHRDCTLGGSEIQCDLIADGLTKKGHEVKYIAPGGERKNNVRSYQVEPCKPESKEIIENVVAFHPDIVYWRYNKNAFHLSVRGIKKHNIPIIFAASSVNDVDPSFLKKKLRIKARIKQLVKSYWNHVGIRYVDAVTVNNRDYLGKLPVSNQTFIPNGMSLEYVTFTWHKPFCSWISSIKQIKRPELAVKLAHDLQDYGVDLIMVGSVQEKEYKWIENHSELPSNLHYLGPKTLEEVSGILHESIVHVHTCLPEGFPNVFIQAWMQGTPSVSLGFDPGGYIKSEGLGFCADENWEKFIHHISHLIENRSQREQMATNARQFSQKMFSTESLVDQVEKLMKSLIN